MKTQRQVLLIFKSKAGLNISLAMPTTDGVASEAGLHHLFSIKKIYVFDSINVMSH